jgi:cytochrome c biogenesis protein CcdA
MNGLFIALGTALWLGILTSVSPCPLATNIAAVSFVGRNVDRARKIVFASILYALGRMCAYTFIGTLVMIGLASIPKLSFLLQRVMNQALGPLLILVGMFLVGLIKLDFLSFGFSAKTEKWSQRSGPLTAFGLGFLFALSFCPVSAALFFGSLIPIAISMDSFVFAPALFGLGTAVPVIVFGVLLALGGISAGKLFKRMTSIETWFSLATGIIIIGIGIYLSLKNTFEFF